MDSIDYRMKIIWHLSFFAFEFGCSFVSKLVIIIV